MHAVDAENVRDLVRIGDDRRRPQRKHEPSELVDHELRRLEVQVRVDESGNDEASGCVQRLAAPVVADARDDAVDDRDVGIEPLAREDREDLSALDDEVGRLVPAADREPSLEPVHRGQRNPSRAAV